MGSVQANAVIAEEIQNASTVVPWVMISSIMLNGIMGLALLVCFIVSLIPNPIFNENRSHCSFASEILIMR